MSNLFVFFEKESNRAVMIVDSSMVDFIKQNSPHLECARITLAHSADFSVDDNEISTVEIYVTYKKPTDFYFTTDIYYLIKKWSNSDYSLEDVQRMLKR